MIFESASKLAAMMRKKEVSSLEVVDAHIRRIEEVNPKLNAFVTTTFDQARSAARENRVGPLAGVPVSIKDTIYTAGVRTTSGTLLREDYVPKTDAPVVARLKAAGAIILGKTNVPECAMDLRTENPVFGRTSNPWNLGHVPGGSSGGEAAAIASGCSPAGVGSDLGGSIRVPAHFCGIAGLKPTPGRIPSTGHFPVATAGPFAIGSSLGPMARRVEDLALLFSVLVGFDPSDPVSVPSGAGFQPALPVKEIRVMWYADDSICPVTAATRDAVVRAAGALADRGLDVIERRPAGIETSHDLWYTWLCEAGVPGIVGLYKDREDLKGPLVKGLERTIRPMTVERYWASWIGRDKLRASVVGEMMDRPIMLAPVAGIPAFEHGHRGGFKIEGQDVEYLKAFSYAQAYNLLGLPAAVVPCGQSPEGLPIGVQIIGRPFDEETVLAVASMLEESFPKKWPTC